MIVNDGILSIFTGDVVCTLRYLVYFLVDVRFYRLMLEILKCLVYVGMEMVRNEPSKVFPSLRTLVAPASKSDSNHCHIMQFDFHTFTLSPLFFTLRLMALNVEHYPTRFEGYWSPSTATLDWCEENYHHTPFIAEFCNTSTSTF